MIYSWPGVSSGLELTSDSLHILAKHPNIIGVKQTDHNVGKMARVVWQNKSEEWTVLGGASDYFL
jgi:4-hydroxy-2-oxoglutarate aldolase